MKKIKLAISGLSVLCLLASTVCFALPINLPESIKGKEGAILPKSSLPDEMGLSAAFVYDYFDRDMKDGDTVNSSFVGGKITLTLLDRLDIYTTLGSMLGPEIKDTSDSSNKMELSDNFMWGVGGDAVIYEWGKNDLALFADGGYREATGIGLDSITLNGTAFSKSQLGGVSLDASYKEWQVALGASKYVSENIIVFAGGQYSDAEIKGSVSGGGSTIGLDSEKSKDKFGPFVGISFIPAKGISIDVTGRFVDETAVSATATVRF